MADQNTSLPVRTQNNGDVVAQIVDGTTTSQKLGVDSSGRVTVKLDDGNGNVVTSQANGAQRALDVGVNVSGVQVDPRSVGQYNSTLPTVSSGSNAPLAINANGVLLTALQTDLTPATQAITTLDLISTSTASGNQTFITGTPTTGSFASFTLSSEETVMFETSGTWTGTLQTEISVDGGTVWLAHSVHLIGSPLFQSSFTANFVGSLNVAAKTQVRVRATAAMTGSCTVKVIQSLNASTIYVANALKLVDSTSGSSTQAQIIAGSTAAATTNTALVVALSPNSGLGAGTNNIGSVNQGTSPWIVKDQAAGSVTGGTAGSFSLLAGLVYNSAAPTLTTGQQASLQGDVNGNLKVDLATSIPAGTNNIGKTSIQDSSGNPFSPTNPLSVTIETSSGTPVNDFKDASGIAALASDNHQYTVTSGKTLTLTQVESSSSGLAKMALAVETGVATGTFTTRFTQFNSTATPNMTLVLSEPIQVAAGVRVQVSMTNREGLLATDLYSTICGHEN